MNRPPQSSYFFSSIVIGIAQVLGWIIGCGFAVLVIGRGSADAESLISGGLAVFGAAFNHALLSGVQALFDIVENTRNALDATDETHLHLQKIAHQQQMASLPSTAPPPSEPPAQRPSL